MKIIKKLAKKKCTNPSCSTPLFIPQDIADQVAEEGNRLKDSPLVEQLSSKFLGRSYKDKFFVSNRGKYYCEESCFNKYVTRSAYEIQRELHL